MFHIHISWNSFNVCPHCGIGESDNNNYIVVDNGDKILYLGTTMAVEDILKAADFIRDRII